MEKILLLGFADQASSKLLAEGATVAANLAASLGCSWEVALIGEKVQEAANTLGGSGAAKFYGVEGEDFAFARYSSDLPAAEALLKESQATVILVPGSSRANRVLSALAMRLGGRADTHITSVTAKEGKVLANRWFYRQRMEACFSRPQRPWVMGLEPGNVAPQTFSASSVQVQMLSVALPDAAKRTKVLGLKYPAGTAQTIRPDAKLLFVAGAGWTKKQADGQIHATEAEKAILDFLSKAQASLGSTKSLVDQSGEGNAVLSFMTHLNQVGQTGSTPRHSKGLATCCHGEEPHVVGWRFVTERRAVNMDANCGWARGKTDVLYVADAFEVMKKVNEILSV
ncbi:MAG: electron transfer flavoprotein subunit alpha [Verrucomicrobiae bacterium]|nr:electron transfer flavoprotein subunit alpha [Verrucomicrobiae bacterium]